MDRNRIMTYAALVLAVSWGLQFLILTRFGLGSGAATITGVAMMWSPTLIALGFLAIRPSSRSGVAWRLGRPAYLPLGIAVETATGLAVVGILVAAGLATSGWFTFGTGGVTISGGPWLLGHGPQGWARFILNVAMTAIAYSTLNLVAATGEEFAWRAFLQGHLIRQFGTRTGILILAAIWWAWHLPVLLAGYDFPQHPYVGALVLFPLQMVGAAFFFGWLTIRARSFWPAALAHGAVNSIQQGVVGNLNLHGSTLAADTLLTMLVLAVGFACWLALEPDRSESSEVTLRSVSRLHSDFRQGLA